MKDVRDDRQCLKYPKTYMLSSVLGKHVKAKHSATLKCDKCTQAFAYDEEETYITEGMGVPPHLPPCL